VTAPKGLKLDAIEKTVRKKGKWILDKLATVRAQAREEPKELLSGEKLLYLGRRYRIKLCKFGPIFQKGILCLPRKNTRQELIADYRNRAESIIEERLRWIEKQYSLKSNGYKIVQQKTRWGSCDKNGLLRINWKIIMASKRIIDYILIHELVHIKIPDHSPKFWKNVEKYLPDYEQRRKWLRINGPLLTF